MSHRALNEGAAKPVEFDGNSDVQVLAGEQSGAPTVGELRAQRNANDTMMPDAANARNMESPARQRPVSKDEKGLRGFLLRLLKSA